MPRRSNLNDDADRPNNPDAISDEVKPIVNAFLNLDRGTQLLIVVLVLVVGGIAFYYFHTHQHATPGTGNSPGQPGYPSSTAGVSSPHLLLGNPSGATADPSQRDNFLMVKPYFVLSYNDAKGTPNWVSWRVTSADLGNAPRKQVFDPDTTLPPGFKVVAHKDYSNSGFDRGHLCPHSDRAANEDMSYATFVMTNIIPQAPNVNEKAWAQMENYCRDLARQGQTLYIVAGPAGRGGRGRNGTRDDLAGGKVTVPAECWKVVVVVPGGGGDDLAQIGPGTRVLSVLMPNDEEAVGEEWAPFRTSPAVIEAKTGLHFFDRLRPEVASALRQKVDATPLPAPVPMRH